MKRDRCRYSGYRFPSQIISYGVWAYHRFCLSFRDVEDLLAESIVHDLRNPPGAIYAAAEMLLDLDPELTQVHRLATNIFRAAGRMRELLADLSSVLLGTKPTPEMCDVREVITSAINAALAVRENRSVQVLLEVPEESSCR
jgi:signal transduction histidine kinase